MRIDPSTSAGAPSNPYFIARAYGLQPGARAKPSAQASESAPTSPVGKIESATTTASVRPTSEISPITPVRRDQAGTDAAKLRAIVAGVVPGKVDFAGETPTQSTGTYALYRRPADRNTAATSINVGRALDVQG